MSSGTPTAESTSAGTGPRIAIIGAGPGGSALASLLAARGANVVVVEASTFPRVKVCGEFISPAATPDLERLVTPEDLRGAGARRVDVFALEWEDRVREWAMPQPAWALSRAALDTLLLRAAAARGARVLQPERVERVDYHATHAALHLAQHDPIEVDLVVHADGSGRHDPAGPVRAARGLVGLKCHYRPNHAGIQGAALNAAFDAPPRACGIEAGVRGVRIRAAAGAYIGTIGVDAGLATCALVAQAALLKRFGGDHDALVKSLWPGFDGVQRVSDWKACPVPRSRYVTPGHERSFRIGNAAGAVDPIGGEGIGLALWSAGVLADVLLPDRDHGPGRWSLDLPDAQRAFARAYRARLRWRLPACAAAARVLMSPRLVRLAWPLLWKPGAIVRPWYALTGKSVRRALRGEPV